MPELLQSDGNYEAYLAQMFNPLAGGSQFNPGFAMGGGNAGFGGVGAGTMNSWGNQYSPQSQSGGLWPQQQVQNPAAAQITQQIAARQAAQAIQHAQAVHALKHLVHQLAAQSQAQLAQAQFGPQAQSGSALGYGLGNIFAAGQIGQAPQTYGVGTQNLINQQNPINQALQQQLQQQALQQQLQQQVVQQQALQQLAQYLASQQPRYGWT